MDKAHHTSNRVVPLWTLVPFLISFYCYLVCECVCVCASMHDVREIYRKMIASFDYFRSTQRLMESTLIHIYIFQEYWLPQLWNICGGYIIGIIAHTRNRIVRFVEWKRNSETNYTIDRNHLMILFLYISLW